MTVWVGDAAHSCPSRCGMSEGRAPAHIRVPLCLHTALHVRVCTSLCARVFTESDELCPSRGGEAEGPRVGERARATPASSAENWEEVVRFVPPHWRGGCRCVCVLCTLSLRTCLHLCVCARAAVASPLHCMRIALWYAPSAFIICMCACLLGIGRLAMGGAVSSSLVFSSAFHRACTHAHAHTHT